MAVLLLLKPLETPAFRRTEGFQALREMWTLGFVSTGRVLAIDCGGEEGAVVLGVVDGGPGVEAEDGSEVERLGAVGMSGLTRERPGNRFSRAGKTMRISIRASGAPRQWWTP
ncbi:hypothetical protein GCM10009560_47250 [Nonomuraea longicatena]|uniref:Uncharacterized protein n=1 Tax=Nonomuraea longicatena TaxID=83682 RepID=A0ABN1Q5D7_9ACTN